MILESHFLKNKIIDAINLDGANLTSRTALIFEETGYALSLHKNRKNERVPS